MKKKALWRDIWQSFKHSKGRFFAIVGLMILGSFALVGLKVTGPDMRDTGAKYFKQLNNADISIIGSMGIDRYDQDQIKRTPGIRQLEFGYFQDATINHSNASFRIFSKPQEISKYQVLKGRLPQKKTEIALDAQYQKQYRIGQSISFQEKNNVIGEKTLKRHHFKISGFVYSGEIISFVDRGQSTAGTGELKGYAVVLPQNFQDKYYTIARLTFRDTKQLNPYDVAYPQKVRAHQKKLDHILADLPKHRLQVIKSQANQQISERSQKLNLAKQQIANQETQLNQAKQQISQAQLQIKQLQQSPLASTPQGNQQIVQAQQQLVAQQANLATKESEFRRQSAKAQQQINQGEKRLHAAKETLAHLAPPSYAHYNRRDAPGGLGYSVYENISRIIDSLANIFPIFLYFVAALVTMATMTRFVDEERTNSGTLKALGYQNYDIIKKFVVYGFISAIMGSLIGIVLGHVLIPNIVYQAYSAGFTVPKITLHFDPVITLVALLLAIISAVLPTSLVALRQLQEKPASLLLPKAPAAGSKILLERVNWLWQRLKFSAKVTARNIFRYKKRMYMTIFGVCGAVCMLFSGLAVQHSISGINSRQFNDLIRYDLIVAQKNYVSPSQKQALQQQLSQKGIKRKMAVHYEQMTKVAGKNSDIQKITLIAPKDQTKFSQFIKLDQRQNQQKLALTKQGVVISERLANLLKVKKGDYLTLRDSTDRPRKMKICGITEMYMGHFVFLNSAAYQEIFHQNYQTNGELITFKKRSLKNVEREAASYMKLGAVAGVVQNTVLINEVSVIVHALDQIMVVLIIIAALLAIVIMYNLTNINVSERIRELSTIKVLGFYNQEVTMYIYRETIYLSLIGVLVGYFFGELLHHYIIVSVPPEDVMFNPALNYFPFLVPLIVIGVITVILGILVNRKLRNIDMLAALKSVD